MPSLDELRSKLREEKWPPEPGPWQWKRGVYETNGEAYHDFTNGRVMARIRETDFATAHNFPNPAQMIEMQIEDILGCAMPKRETLRLLVDLAIKCWRDKTGWREMTHEICPYCSGTGIAGHPDSGYGCSKCGGLGTVRCSEREYTFKRKLGSMAYEITLMGRPSVEIGTDRVAYQHDIDFAPHPDVRLADDILRKYETTWAHVASKHLATVARDCAQAILDDWKKGAP